MTRCSACFSDDCSPSDTLCCVVCKLHFHIKCTSWKNLDPNSVERLKNDWHCIFCRKNQIKHVLFVVGDTNVGIRQLNVARRSSLYSIKNFERKMLNVKKTNFNSTFILDDMLKSLGQLKLSVGSLSDHNMQWASDNVKFQKIIGDMSYKMENLYLA